MKCRKMKDIRRKVKDIRPAHGGRGGHAQVIHLKLHGHSARQFDARTVVEAKCLVVVEDGVHGFYPKGIHGPVAAYLLFRHVPICHRIAGLSHDR